MRLNLKIIYSHRGNNNNMLDNIVYIFFFLCKRSRIRYPCTRHINDRSIVSPSIVSIYIHTIISTNIDLYASMDEINVERKKNKAK